MIFDEYKIEAKKLCVVAYERAKSECLEDIEESLIQEVSGDSYTKRDAREGAENYLENNQP